MKRLRIFFAVMLLLLALPFWRFADMVAITSPFHLPLVLALTMWFGIFVVIPVKLLSQLKTYVLVSLIFIFALSAYFIPSLSEVPSTDPTSTHCGRLTYTGMIYPLRGILTEAHNDDLEARNQMCWVRKLISEIPDNFDLAGYSKIIHEQLLKPERKYRVALPFIAALFVRLNFSDEGGARNIYDSLHFWIDHYTEEISQRSYPVWNWPHSKYIQFEYGLIERNWQELIDNIVIES